MFVWWARTARGGQVGNVVSDDARARVGALGRPVGVDSPLRCLGARFVSEPDHYVPPASGISSAVTRVVCLGAGSLGTACG